MRCGLPGSHAVLLAVQVANANLGHIQWHVPA